MDATEHFYSRPSNLGPYFSGGRRQVGGGIFGSLARAVLPGLKDFGKAAAKRAMGTAVDIARDMASGSSVKDAFANRGKELAKDTFSDGVRRITGNGLKRPPPGLLGLSRSIPSKRLKRSGGGFKQGCKRKRKGKCRLF